MLLKIVYNMLILLFISSTSYSYNHLLIDDYIRDDMIKFLHLNYSYINSYVVYEIFDIENRTIYLNCFNIKKHHNNKMNNINIDNVNINIYDSFIGTKKVELIGYIIINDKEQIDIDFDITMKQYATYKQSNHKTTIPLNTKYKILYIKNNKNLKYCIIN